MISERDVLISGIGKDKKYSFVRRIEENYYSCNQMSGESLRMFEEGKRKSPSIIVSDIPKSYIHSHVASGEISVKKIDDLDDKIAYLIAKAFLLE